MLLFLLACASTPPQPPPPDWIEAAVQDALAAEQMPGTTGEEDPARPGQLRSFFAAHPEYADQTRLDALLADACADGIEGTHARLLDPPPRAPLVVEVGADPWRLVVIHAASRCTSDDWSWFTHEVEEAMGARGVPTAYADADHDAVVVQRAGQELGRYPLSGQGYLALEAGRAPVEAAHAPPEEVITALNAALRLPAAP